jgi:hypothetical protein
VLFIEGRVLARAWGRVYLVLALDSWMSTDFVEICLGANLEKSSFGSSG